MVIAPKAEKCPSWTFYKNWIIYFNFYWNPVLPGKVSRLRDSQNNSGSRLNLQNFNSVCDLTVQNTWNQSDSNLDKEKSDLVWESKQKPKFSPVVLLCYFIVSFTFVLSYCLLLLTWFALINYSLLFLSSLANIYLSFLWL